MDFLGQRVHIVGLGVDSEHPGLRALLQHRRNSRVPRAQAMAAGFGGGGHCQMPTRGRCSTQASLSSCHAPTLRGIWWRSGAAPQWPRSFRHYLVPGKPGYAPHGWAALHDGIAQVVAAGGVAVLAHPGRYKLERLPMQILLDRFAQSGEARPLR